MSRIDEAVRKAALAGAAPIAADLEAPAERPDVEWTVEEHKNGEPALSKPAAAEPVPWTAERQVSVTFPGFTASFADKVVTGSMDPPYIEQYRRLASILHQTQVERQIKVVMVTSALGQEGKTLTTANLALALADSFHRNVLLIDADLRRPGLHEVFNLPNATGLSDTLKGEADEKLSLFQVAPRLCLAPAGRPDLNPLSLLISDRMRQVLEEAGRAFDWIIIDTPPLALIPDGHLLNMLADVTLLVIKAGQTQLPMVERVITALGRERIVGVVLNRVEPQLPDYGGYHGYYAMAGERG
jgi:capsular exopolysaccharide synthesis family protein